MVESTKEDQNVQDTEVFKEFKEKAKLSLAKIIDEFKA